LRVPITGVATGSRETTIDFRENAFGNKDDNHHFSWLQRHSGASGNPGIIDVRSKLDAFDLDDAEYDRMYELDEKRALEPAQAELDKRLRNILKTMDHLYR